MSVTGVTRASPSMMAECASRLWEFLDAVGCVEIVGVFMMVEVADMRCVVCGSGSQAETICDDCSRRIDEWQRVIGGNVAHSEEVRQ